MAGLKLLRLEPDDAMEMIERATVNQIVKSEPDEDPSRPYWILELALPCAGFPRGVYAKVALHRPGLSTGYCLAFKPSD